MGDVDSESDADQDPQQATRPVCHVSEMAAVFRPSSIGDHVRYMYVSKYVAQAEDNHTSSLALSLATIRKRLIFNQSDPVTSSPPR